MTSWPSISADIAAGLDTLAEEQRASILVLLNRFANGFRERPVDANRLILETRAAATNVAPLMSEHDVQMEICCHEAGHAIVARALGLTVTEMSAQADARAQGWAKIVPVAPALARTPGERDAIERHIQTELAGAIAGANRARLDWRSPSSEDWQHHEVSAREFATRISDIDESEIESYLMWMKARARALVFRYWGEITLVASALYLRRTLNSDDIEQLLAAPTADQEPMPSQLETVA